MRKLPVVKFLWTPDLRAVGKRKTFSSKLWRLSKIVRRLRRRNKKRLIRDKGEGC